MEEVCIAAQENDLPVLAALLDADPSLLQTGRSTPLADWDLPLHIACCSGSTEAACLLLDRGADISGRCIWGMTPLMMACGAGWPAIVALLLERGADPTELGPFQMTALTWAAGAPFSLYRGSDHVAVVRLLLEDGRVPVDAKDSQGRTALWHACSHGHVVMARVLLVEGHADQTIANMLNITPLDEAERPSSPEVVQKPALVRLLKWYKGEWSKPFLLFKARAVVNATEIISKAPKKVKTKTEAEGQKAREGAAPVYLRSRVKRWGRLPAVTVMGQRNPQGADKEAEAREAERRAVLEYVVRRMNEDLFVEMMQGLRRR